jgi:hypothetical protein
MLAKKKSTTIIFYVIVIGQYYFLKTNQHVLNEHVYVSRDKDFVI